MKILQEMEEEEEKQREELKQKFKKVKEKPKNLDQETLETRKPIDAFEVKEQCRRSGKPDKTDKRSSQSPSKKSRSNGKDNS